MRFGGQVAGPPEIPACDGTPWLPAFGSGFHDGGPGEIGGNDLIRWLELTEGQGEAFADAVVRDREDIGAAEAEHEEHFDRPGADAADLGKMSDDVGIGHPMDAGEGWDGSIESPGGEVADGEGLVVGESGGTELVVGGVKQVLGGRVGGGFTRWERLGKAGEELGVDARGGLAVELLVDDGAEQGLKGRLRGAEFEGEWSCTFDETTKSRVARGEFGDGAGSIVARGA